MQTYLRTTPSLKTPIFWMLFSISVLTSVLLLTGCGQGLAGQATGEDAEDIGVLKQSILDISDSLVELDERIVRFEKVEDTEDTQILKQEILDISNNLANLNEGIGQAEDAIDVLYESVADLISLVESDGTVEDVGQTTTITVSGVDGNGADDSGTFALVTEDADVILPSSLTVLVNSNQDWGSWGNGSYTRCTGTPCGHLTSTTIHGREVYVKPSGVTDDPNHHWYYAYIFLKQSGSQTWPIQYVIPSSQWMAHRYFDSANPWGNWGDLEVRANYD